jgi:hypothetical protein
VAELSAVRSNDSFATDQKSLQVLVNENWLHVPDSLLFPRHAATSIRNSVWGLLCTSRAPGTIPTSAEEVPISRNSKSRPLRRERDSRAVFRQFNFRPGHFGEEQPPNILQSFLNKFLNLSEPCVEPPAVSREEFFADRVEFPLALPQLIDQRGRSVPFRNGAPQVRYPRF